MGVETRPYLEKEMEDKKQTRQRPIVESVPHTSLLVKVCNNTSYFFVQPSTGIRIESKGVAEFRNDGWLKNQLAAKLLSKV